jgi:microcystin-dependent protein
MKNIFLTLLLLLISLNFFAQAQFTESGIAVQGIVRDANNTAIQNQTIDLTFTFYYNTTSEEKSVNEITKSVLTDGFGVFSTIINPLSGNNLEFSNNPVSLRIKRGDFLISESLLSHVPYAISANNGVPTGSIMPFAGSVAPNGWVLCDGAVLPANAVELKKIVGNKAPDLRGVFLRGTGTYVNSTTNVGPSLNNFQGDADISHNHSINLTGSTNTDGKHGHVIADVMSFTGDSLKNNNGGDGNGDKISSTRTDGGEHKHAFTLSGNSANAHSASESRPVNYGVNYIIKL